MSQALNIMAKIMEGTPLTTDEHKQLIGAMVWVDARTRPLDGQLVTAQVHDQDGRDYLVTGRYFERTDLVGWEDSQGMAYGTWTGFEDVSQWRGVIL